MEKTCLTATKGQNQPTSNQRLTIQQKQYGNLMVAELGEESNEGKVVPQSFLALIKVQILWSKANPLQSDSFELKMLVKY